MGVTEERKEAKFCEGGERDGRHINTDRFRGGKNGTKIIIDNVDGGHEGVGGDNGMKKSVDGGKGDCVGPYFVVYLYSMIHLCLQSVRLLRNICQRTLSR